VPSVVTALEAITHEGSLLLAADQTPLAGRDLLVPAKFLISYISRLAN